MKLPAAQEMERAYKTSDAACEAIFFLAVRTTGIFCKPSCPARKPDPRNGLVGHANGLNRISIVIPCRRVVNKNGDLGGYGGGFRRK